MPAPARDEEVLVDAGLMFPDDEQLGVDLVLPDYSYVLENEHKLRGILITHGHEDHIGALPYLLMDLSRKVPIYSSKLTLGIIEGKLSEHRLNAPRFREVHDLGPRRHPVRADEHTVLFQRFDLHT